MSIKNSHHQQEVHLKELKPAKDPRYGNVVLYNDPSNGAVYTRKDKVFLNKKQVKQVALDIQNRISNPNLFYVAPMTYEFEQVSIPDSSSSHGQKVAPVMKLFMPYPHDTLDKELQMRIEKSNPLNNKQITYLMYDIMYGMYHLQTLGYNHGKFGPEFVARTTTGYAILDDPMYYQYDVINLKRRKYWYLCPKAFECAMLKKKAGTNYDLVKSDVFAFGLVMLEAAIQMDIDDIYGDPESKSLDVDALDQLITVMENRYSENNLVVSTIKKMLSFDEKERPDFKEMVERMPAYQMIKNYFEQVEMAPEDLKSMRNSIHGSVANTRGAKEFGKMTPSGSKALRQSMKNSRYYEEDNSETFNKMEFFKKDMETMITSEVVEKHVVQHQVSELGTESESMVHLPHIMIKTQKSKKPPTPKKKHHDKVKENEAIAALQKQVEFLTQALLMQNKLQEDKESTEGTLKAESVKSERTKDVDIEVLVQKRVQEELKKLQGKEKGDENDTGDVKKDKTETSKPEEKLNPDGELGIVEKNKEKKEDSELDELPTVS